MGFWDAFSNRDAVAQIVEYSAGTTNLRTGTAQTTDGSSWAAIIDVDISLAKVYNSVDADYVAVTSSGKVTAFQVGPCTLRFYQCSRTCGRHVTSREAFTQIHGGRQLFDRGASREVFADSQEDPSLALPL